MKLIIENPNDKDILEYNGKIYKRVKQDSDNIEDQEYCADCCFENNHMLCELFQDIMNTICSTDYIYEQINKLK